MARSNYRVQYVICWYLVAMLLVALAGVPVSQAQERASDNLAQDGFNAWLQDMADTSDSDDATPADAGSDLPSLTAGGSSPGSSSSSTLDDDDDDAKKHHKKHSGSNDHSSSKAPKENYDSIGVKPPPTGEPKTITVNKHGDGDFKTINEALNSIKPGVTYRTIIKIKAGVYEEKVTINATQPYITFLGDGMNETIITWNDTAGDFDDNDIMLKTYRSASVGISSEWFIAKGVQFRNSAPQPAPGAVLKQAVAMRISADRASFYNCSFYGYQDTLYDHNGRHYFENCLIVGSIDFIFGNGRSLYRACHLLEVADSFGSLSAQKRNESRMHTGFSFLDCRVDGKGLQIYLGRAWGNYSRTVYSYTYMNDIIYSGGWSDFGFPQRDHQVFFGQYKCYGPGANTSQRVPWAINLTPKQVKPFLSVNFINGKNWLTSYIKKPKFT